MELEVTTADTYMRLAFRQILEVADRLGDESVNVRPPGPETNTVAQLITHCCGVSEFWLGCVGLGRPRPGTGTPSSPRRRRWPSCTRSSTRPGSRSAPTSGP